jgi:hypothetical protein
MLPYAATVVGLVIYTIRKTEKVRRIQERAAEASSIESTSTATPSSPSEKEG